MQAGVYYSYFPHSEIVDWEAILRRAVRCGAEWVELSSMRLVEQDQRVRDRVRAVAAELGLRYTFCTSLPPDGDVSSDDPAQRRRGIEFIKGNIALCSQMEGRVVGGMLHGSTRKNHPVDNATRPKRLEHSAEAVREMAKTAGEYGVTLGLEMCNRYENTMLNTVEQGLEFLEILGCPSVGLHLDTYHMNIEEDDLAGAILRAKGRIVHVHACENNRKLPGMGHLNWREILLALAAAGYKGGLLTECFAVPFGPWTNNMCLWREYLREGIDEDLTASMGYLKGLLAALGLRQSSGKGSG